MTRTDLRLAYKMDTGDSPLWKEDHNGKSLGYYNEVTWAKGYPRTQYGLWIEDKIGKYKYLRDRYYKVHSEVPCRSYFAPGTPHESLTGEYIEWLETFVLRFYKHIVTNIINI